MENLKGIWKLSIEFIGAKNALKMNVSFKEMVLNAFFLLQDCLTIESEEFFGDTPKPD